MRNPAGPGQSREQSAVAFWTFITISATFVPNAQRGIADICLLGWQGLFSGLRGDGAKKTRPNTWQYTWFCGTRIRPPPPPSQNFVDTLFG